MDNLFKEFDVNMEIDFDYNEDIRTYSDTDDDDDVLHDSDMIQNVGITLQAVFFYYVVIVEFFLKLLSFLLLIIFVLKILFVVG